MLTVMLDNFISWSTGYSPSTSLYCYIMAVFTLLDISVHQRMSQFWYSDETATRLVEEVIHEAGKGGR